MARIRSIKPEFATDGKVRRLSDTTALFFILLWNHCDDSGYFNLDTWELAMKTARWRSQDIMRMLWALHRHGMVKLSLSHGVGMVASWTHQRIDKPRPSKWDGVEIQWDDAPPLQEAADSIPRKERRGEERKGKERISSTGVNPAGNLPAPPKPKSDPSKSIPTWEAYREAYSRRYGIAPIRNASVNARIAQFVSRIGVEESPLVAAFYLTHNDAVYVRAMHPVGLLLRDAEKLRTEWATGRKMTGDRARNAETTDYHQDQLRRIAEGTL